MNTAAHKKTETKKLEGLDALIQTLWKSSESSFYRNIWKERPPQLTSLSDLQRIPTTSWETLVSYPLRERTYSGEPGLFTKLTYRNDKPLLVGRTFDDITREHYGVPADRPLLIFSSQHEMLEKSIWQYEHNHLPLLCNQNAEITASLAQLYETDCIVCDTEGLKTYLPALVQAYDRAHIKDVIVIDTSFDLPFLRKQFSDSALHCVFAPPEVGTTGIAQPTNDDNTLLFAIDPHTLIEIDDNNELTVSRTLELPTPIIRYRTGYKAAWDDREQTRFSVLSA